jgi:redox-sensitive bicupin YhaK (pirin superfamily)
MIKRIKFWWWRRRNKPRLQDLAEQATKVARDAGLSGTQVMGALMENAARQREQMLQHMIDSVVEVQVDMPMPREGWERFIRDLQHTNEKYGMNLRIRK